MTRRSLGKILLTFFALGVIALAEYLAETQSLTHLDIRENDIRLGGIMALASSLKFNRTLTRLDIDKDLKRESFVSRKMIFFKFLSKRLASNCRLKITQNKQNVYFKILQSHVNVISIMKQREKRN